MAKPEPEPDQQQNQDQNVPHRIREAWEDATGTEPAEPQEPSPKQDQGLGRPGRSV